MNRLFASLILMLALIMNADFGLAQAQEQEQPPPLPVRIGVFVGGLYSMHSGGFHFPESTEAPITAYDEGTAFGPSFGIRFDLPLLRNLHLSPRLFAECRRGDFTSDPFTMEIIGQDLQPQSMTLEDDLEVTMRMAGIDLMLQWSPFGTGPYLLAGPTVGMKLYEEFRVTERIVEPALVTFLDGSRSKEMYDDDPEFTRDLTLGLRAGVGYTLALNRDMALGVEAQYLMLLQPVREDGDWSMAGLQATVALLFAL